MWQRRERELEKELRFHLENQVEENLRAGMTPEEARRQAILAFGSPAAIGEECRELRTLHWLGTIAGDLRYALRSFCASPLFACTAVTSIALGIGANAAIFTLLHAALWKPLPVPQPTELFDAVRSDSTGEEPSYSWRLYEELREAVAPYGRLFARGSAGLRRFSTGGAEQERVIGEAVSGDYFSALEIQPFAGRLIDRRDEDARQPVAVLSHAFWTRRFHADPSVFGRIVQYNEMPFRIIGAAQAGFDGIDAGVPTEVWVPVKVVDSRFVADGIHSSWLALMLRTKHAPAGQAAIEGRFARHVAEELLPHATVQRYRESLKSQSIRLRPAASGLGSRTRTYERALLVVMAIVGVVLAISCANVANLLLARNLSRRHELAIRAALGAGRGRLASQLLTESLILALAGSATGLAIGEAGCRWLLHLLPSSRLPLNFDLSPDATVLTLTALAALITALACGAGPVLQMWRSGADGLRHDGKRVTERSFGRKLLVAGQLALSLVLVAGAGLFLKNLHGLATADLGFRPEHVMAFEFGFPRAASTGHQAQVHEEMFERLAGRGFQATYASPGVYEDGGWSRTLSVVDGKRLPPGEDTEAQMLAVGPAFFEMLGIQVLAGRTFDLHDRQGSALVSVVNETFARKFFPGISPVGHRVGTGQGKGSMVEIIGVVRDVKHMGVKKRAWPAMYWPALQMDGFDLGTLLVRARLPQADLARLVRAELQNVDSSAQVAYTTTLESVVDSMISSERLIAFLSTAFGGLAILLAAIGLYGVVAYGMSRRTGEIGIRMALGARPADIQWLALSESLRLVAVGVLAGVPAALAGGRLVHGLLFGTSSADPWVLGTAAVVMVAVTFLAGWLPAARAAGIDPSSALRQE
ncbi:MAG TPA: ABC transporter permease [Bryobacteraceae bacterium]|nr:ABC transporter permease [Bryobacteraceae bacterium]